MDNGTDEAVLHSINPELVEMGANIKRNISEIVTPAADEIPARRTFIPHARNLKAPADMIVDLDCIDLNVSQAALCDTTKRGIRSSILLIEHRYKADRVFSTRQLNAHFATDTFFQTLDN